MACKKCPPRGRRGRLIVAVLTAVAVLGPMPPAAAQDEVRLDLSPRRTWGDRGVRYRIVNNSDRPVSFGLERRLDERQGGRWRRVDQRRYRSIGLRVSAGERSAYLALIRCERKPFVCRDLRERRYRLQKPLRSGGRDFRLRRSFRGEPPTDDVRLDLSPRRNWSENGVKYRVVNDSKRRVSYCPRCHALRERRGGEWRLVGDPPTTRRSKDLQPGSASRYVLLERDRRRVKALADRRYRLDKKVGISYRTVIGRAHLTQALREEFRGPRT